MPKLLKTFILSHTATWVMIIICTVYFITTQFHLTKELFKKNITVDDLKEDDVFYELRQKGIDIKIGVDIASMAIKRLVDRIVLFSGDSDFVPAAKLARREGIDFILDPMWNPIDDNLFEHIDGLKSTCPKPVKTRK